jgi:hypothetical protein
MKGDQTSKDAALLSGFEKVMRYAEMAAFSIDGSRDAGGQLKFEEVHEIKFSISLQDATVWFSFDTDWVIVISHETPNQKGFYSKHFTKVDQTGDLVYEQKHAIWTKVYTLIDSQIEWLTNL